jgi:hypothetical protein
MNHKKESPALQGNSINNNLNDTAVTAQRKRILERLPQQPLTTVQARDELNVMAPAARIFELRYNYGFNIVTNWIVSVDSSGRKHRMAQYVLLSGKFRGVSHG